MDYICPKCEHIVKDIFSNQDVDTCPLCNTRLKILKTEKVSHNVYTEVTCWIKELGVKEAWRTIEMIVNPYERLKYRTSFFGIVADKNLTFDF